jgi:hypothetical protein
MSAGSAIGTLFNILMIGGVYGVLGFAVVKINAYANTLQLSADAMNTIYFLDVGFAVSGVLILIAYIINHWVNSKNEASQGV